MFADGYPLLITTKESLDMLNSWIRADSPNAPFISMDRFRPNIVISGNMVSDKDRNAAFLDFFVC